MASNDVNILVKLTAGKNPLYFFAAICRLQVLAIFGPPRRGSGSLSDDVSS
jgi:hypothetical protein